ncbi:MAG: hypothetical protein OEM85_14990 [Gammaproteobacteria bacterium]|nr:hypothetical protein [Gammaproteobacteria bacterium]MDH3374670.1 hypothetical protein [Gammaproteobacteria bacterium]MDH3410155.1 hypothetical protein [Gammaproteobacteria bacterium]
MKTIAVVMLAGLLAGCATPIPPFTGPKGLNLNPYTVDITWSATETCKVVLLEEEPTTCIIPGIGLCVGRGDFIVWRSKSPPNVKYEIFFDPIYGARLKAGHNGIIVRPIDANAPIATYKYSIVREGCAPNLANTYDPHIRIDH